MTEQLHISLVEIHYSVFGLGKVDQKLYSSSMKPMQMMQWDHEKEIRARSYQNVKTACSTILLKLRGHGLHHLFEKWVESYKKCIACQGRYLEKETVTAPPESSDLE